MKDRPIHFISFLSFTISFPTLLSPLVLLRILSQALLLPLALILPITFTPCLTLAAEAENAEKAPNNTAESPLDEDSSLFKLAFTYPIDIQNYAPERHTLSHFREVSGQLFLPLISQQTTGKVVPAAAEKWHWSKDRKKLTFSLRKDLRWSDGTPLTAHDFVFTLKRIALNEDFFWEFENTILGWEQWKAGNKDAPFGFTAITNHNLEVEFTEPGALEIFPFSSVIATYIAGSRPLVEHSKSWKQLKYKPSNGPYQLGQVLEERIILTKNKYFPDHDKVTSKEIHILGGEGTNGLLEFSNGNVDALIGPLGKQNRWISEHYREQVHVVSTPKLYIILPDSRKSIFDNKDILDALYLALDRDNFGSKQFGSLYQHVEGIIPKGFAGYSGLKRDENWGTYEERLTRAKHLMHKAGYSEKNPLKLKIAVAHTVPGYKDIAGFVRGSWQGIHVDLELVSIALYTDMISRFKQEEFDLTISSFNADYYNQLAYLRLLQEFSAITDVPLDPRYTKALKEISLLKDKRRQADLIKKLDYQILKNRWVFPIAISNGTALIKAGLDGIEEAANNRFPRLNIRYIKKKERKQALKSP